MYHKYSTLLYNMDNRTCTIYKGEKFSLEWYFDKKGKSVVYEYFIESSEDLQDKFLILVKKMGDFRKKSEKLPKNEKVKAINCRSDYFERKAGG